MAVMMELEHLQKSPTGRWQYRRRVPKQQQDFAGMKTFKRVLEAKEGAALRREYATVEAEFERLVNRSPVPATPPPSVAVSPRQQWDKAVGEANHLVARGAIGLDEDELREVLAEELHRKGGKDLVVKALMVPNARPPERTLQDAVKHVSVRSDRSAAACWCRLVTTMVGGHYGA